MKKDNASTFRRVIRYLRGHLFYLCLSLLFAAVTVVATLRIPVLIGNAIDAMIGEGQVLFQTVADALWRIGILTGISALAQWLLSLCNNRLSYGVVHDLREDVFRRLQHTPVSYIDNHKTGDLVSRMIADADTFADGLLLGFTQLFSGVLTIVGTLFLMLRVQPIIAVAVVILTPLSLFVARFIAVRTHNMFLLQSQIRGEETAYMNETVTNQKVVKVFGHEKASVFAFDEVNGRLQKASLRATFFSSLTNPCTRFINSLVYGTVAVLGAFVATGNLSLLGSTLTVGGLSAFLSYANQYTKPFNEISGVITELQNSFACAERIFDLLDAPELPPDPADARVLGQAEGRVGFHDVSFSYTPERPLLRNITMEIPEGAHVAIVGPTGCGKTTLINLLMRFYDVDQGEITVDGTDIREITRKSLRSSYGMVLQESFLQYGTVWENIAIGKPDATKEEMVAAAKKAHADSFIRRLPKGYDTLIGDEGEVVLSEGQKQLLCIARVMLALPPILILDEATSSIDTRTERKIQDAFNVMMQGRTSFIVAHRLSTIREADLILVMKDGNIIEKGTHTSLLNSGGFYANLYQSQFEN